MASLVLCWLDGYGRMLKPRLVGVLLSHIARSGWTDANLHVQKWMTPPELRIAVTSPSGGF